MRRCVRRARVRGCGGATLVCIVLASIVAGVAPGAAQQPPPLRGLTAAPQVARAYDAIFEARFEEVPQILARTCPPAPAEACRLLEAVALWWQIQLDPFNTTRDGAFRSQADASIAAAEAWTAREPHRAEAWFYLGAAYGARVQWRVLRGERLAAARDGKRIKHALERAVALDPTLHDAYFGIGLYHYYADVAPAALKVLRWLLLLPGGNRAQGLSEMRRAHEAGQLVRSEADYQLHLVYLWYEKNPEEALARLEALERRHPRNPHFRQLTADVQDAYLHDVTASLRSWQALLELARQGRVNQAGMAEATARLGIARQLDRLFETDRAIEHVRAVIAANPPAPFAAVARAQLQLGEALDRLGRRAEATAAYRAAIAAAAQDDPLGLGERARAGLRSTPDATAARAYRLSLEGWRALERGAPAEARRAFEESLALKPGDPVTRYRQARLLHAQNQDAAAIAMLENIVGARAATPPTIYASACLDAARLLEQRGSRARAIELYRAATEVFGADAHTKEAARRALERLTAS